MVLFDRQHISDGVKRAASWIKDSQADDPRVAILASIEVLIAACKVAGCKRTQVMKLIDALVQEGEEATDAVVQRAVSELYRKGIV